MRILPFGDGVVLGEGASGGFRTPLEEMLQSASIPFQFIGRRTENSYEMAQPNHEGWPRATFSFLRDECLEPAMALGPDIMLLYAGIEDVKQVPDSGIAVARCEKLVKAAHALKSDCTIICSQLITARDYLAEQKVKKFNVGLGTMVENLSKKGIAISRVKMHAKVKSENLNEFGMPNEAGYLQMAQIWFDAIEEIVRRNCETADG